MASTDPSARKDAWNTSDYTSAASFVPQLTTKLLTLLSPTPSDIILDIGCGDGYLTSKISSSLSSPSQIRGIDLSQSMITSAARTYPTISFSVHDCAKLDDYVTRNTRGKFTKIVSNAAMHWILASSYARETYFSAIHDLLAPGGAFVFEMGGAGNVAEVHSTVLAAMRVFGVHLETAKSADPWLFPSKEWMKGKLEGAGLEVELVEEEYRPTKLTPETEDGKGGASGWVRLMCSAWLELVEKGKRDEAVEWVRQVLEPVMKREDGTWVVGYVRLRGVARRKA